MTEPENKENKSAEEQKEKSVIYGPRRLGNYSQDGRCYGRTPKGTYLRINPATGKVVPRVRLSKKERLRMRAEVKKMAQAKEGNEDARNP